MGKNNLYLIIIQIFLIFVECNTLVAENKKVENVQDEKSAGKPKVVFEEQTYDFGKIYQGEIVQHEFRFKNQGNDDLIINNVKSSCGCTAALASKNNIPKGETGEIQIKFNPGHYLGKVLKTVTVNSNDPENAASKLTITGEVCEEISINPRLVNFGIVKKGESCSRNLEIRIAPELKIEIKKIESPNPYITIVQKKTSDNIYSCQITMNKNDYIGKFNGIIFVYTNNNKQEKIDVPFYGEIIGDVTIYPEMLLFGVVKKNQEVKRTIVINFMNKDVKIEKIEADPDVINYAVSELNNNSKKIDVKLSKDTTPGKITGSLKIYTNSAIQPVINIPIKGEVKG